MLTTDMSAVRIFAHKNIDDKVWMEKQQNLANTFPGELHVEQREEEKERKRECISSEFNLLV